MPETTQTENQAAVQQGAQTNELLGSIQTTMGNVGSSISGLGSKLDSLIEVFSKSDGKFYQNMNSAFTDSLTSIEQEKASNALMKEQHELALQMERGNEGPMRGDPNFLASLLATTPESNSEAQAKALKKTLTDSEVKRYLSEAFGTDTIREAVSSKVDDRTFGEKALDKMGLGGINKLTNWVKDRRIRREEKATSKDQAAIKRDMKDINRLSAEFREKKEKGAGEEELNKILSRIESLRTDVKGHERKIDARRRDPYADLVEMKGSLADQVRTDIRDKVPEQRIKADATAQLVGIGNNMRELLKMGSLTESGPKFEPVNIERPGQRVDPMAASPELAARKSRAVDAEIVTPAASPATDGSGAASGAPDMKEYFDTKRKQGAVQEDFYRKGIEFFKMGTNKELFDMSGIESAIKKGGMGMGGKGAMATAVIASLGAIALASKGLKDWYNASNEAVETTRQMMEANNAEIESRRNAVNSDRQDALLESNEADQALHESEESWTDSIGDKLSLGGLLFKSDRQKAREKKESADANLKAEQMKMKMRADAARKSGVDPTDTKAFEKWWKDEQELRKQGMYNTDHRQTLAAGTTVQATPATAQTPSAGVSPEKAETAEEQAARVEEATFNGTKRALMDSDVQKQNEANAKLSGSEINEKIVGRK